MHFVASRQGFHEYACDCGHSFLKAEPGRSEVKHPPVCLFAGHFLISPNAEATMTSICAATAGTRSTSWQQHEWLDLVCFIPLALLLQTGGPLNKVPYSPPARGKPAPI